MLLVHNNVNTGDGFANHTDLAQFGGCTTGDLSNLKGAELGLQVIELLGQLFFLFAAQIGALDTRLE